MTFKEFYLCIRTYIYIWYICIYIYTYTYTCDHVRILHGDQLRCEKSCRNPAWKTSTVQRHWATVKAYGATFVVEIGLYGGIFPLGFCGAREPWQREKHARVIDVC